MNSSSEQGTVSSFHYPLVHAPEVAPKELPWQSEAELFGEAGWEERLAQARAEARSEGELQARTYFDRELREVRAAVSSAINQFTLERARYLRTLEKEAVKLSLTIARRVLHRESQVDPELLLGLVRSSLTELSDTSPIRLFVHTASVEDWQNHLRENALEHQEIEVRADPKLQGHECRIESSMGTTTLSLEGSLNEIENGLFDLLSASVPSADRHTLQ